MNDQEKYRNSGKPYVFKMTLDDGWATYEYDLNLTENWSLFDIEKGLKEFLEKNGGTITNLGLIGEGYKNEKEEN